MKISQMIKNLQTLMEDYGDMDCWYAVDDEGNGYNPIHFEPSVYYANHYGEIFQEDELKNAPPEDLAELTAVCIVN